MSPEQAKGRAADRRSDVWSFGCLLFEMLAGSRAFDGEDITDTIAAIVRGEPNWQALPAIDAAGAATAPRAHVDQGTSRASAGHVGGPLHPQRTGHPRARRGRAPAVSQRTRGPRSRAVPGSSRPSSSAQRRSDWPSRTSRRTAAAETTSGRPAHFTIVLPDGTEVTNINMAPLAIAPDGQTVAFAGTPRGKDAAVRQRHSPPARRNRSTAPTTRGVRSFRLMADGLASSRRAS